MSGAYYNENDPFAAAWLRALIFFGEIASGDVDERSIEDVTAEDLRGYDQHHFFAGIGVWSYALRRAGWPDDRPVWTGSCPCQPFSAAGKGGGFADERHLWPAWHWLIDQHRPDVVFGEQVASKDGLEWFDLVSTDLEGSLYTVGASDQCVAGFGGPHIRQRLWYVGLQQPQGDGRVQRWSESERRRLERGCGPGGLRDTAHQQQHRSGCAGPGRRDEPSNPSGSGGLSDDQGDGRQWRADDGDQGRRERAPGPDSAAGGVCLSCGAGHAGRPCAAADDDRRGEVGIVEGRQPASPGGPGGLPHHHHQGLPLGSVEADERRIIRFEGSTLGADEPLRGHWRGADWLWFRDGKYRPVEPGTFPLAHGAPARVGRLRGYGNAICAVPAQAFIEAVMACL